MKKLHLSNPKLFTRLSAIAACSVLACGVAAYAYMAPATYVSMDVNPSIEYTLNQFDRVLSVQAVNEDGAKILLEVKDVNNQTIDEAIRMTLNEIGKAGYFDGNVTGGVVIATSGKEKESAKQLASHLEDLVTAQCAEKNYTVSVESMAVEQSQLEEAKAWGVTPGKLLLVQQLQAENPDAQTLPTEEWLRRSVREIMAETERLDELNDAQEDADDAVEDAQDDAKDAAEDAQDDAKDAAEDAQDEAEDAAEDAQEAAEKELEALAEAAEEKRDAEDKARDLAEDAEEKARDLAEEAEEAKADAAKDTDRDTDANDEATDAEDGE